MKGDKRHGVVILSPPTRVTATGDCLWKNMRSRSLPTIAPDVCGAHWPVRTPTPGHLTLRQRTYGWTYRTWPARFILPTNATHAVFARTKCGFVLHDQFHAGIAFCIWDCSYNRAFLAPVEPHVCAWQPTIRPLVFFPWKDFQADFCFVRPSSISSLPAPPARRADDSSWSSRKKLAEYVPEMLPYYEQKRERPSYRL
jgi:hypothetical protein